MKYNQSFTKISTDEQLMETASHGSEDFPFKFYYENLTLFDFNCIEWHWHTEFEFVYVEKGFVTVNICDKQFTLEEGNAIFINSKILHKFYSKEEAIIPNFLCIPHFISEKNSLIYKKYILPILNSSLDFVVFSPNVAWQKKAIKIFLEIICLCDEEKNISNNELLILSNIQKLWSIIFSNTKHLQKEENQNQNALSLYRLQMMMQYIHTNFALEISLEDLCKSSNMSKTSVLNLFKKFLCTSPINYLINYRLQVASKLLKNTQKSVKSISIECGFESVDYFCKTFKKHYGVTPSVYRKGE